ncbi:MAG TPA: histidine kinase [Candidatus Limnocylindrales bacterium]|nr:histidine kinase [Candidatus Limnocylindrales bacterium]
MASTDPAGSSESPGELSARVTRNLATLDRELAEIDLLVQQARTEAERHEQKRAQQAEKIAGLPEATPAGDALALSTQLVSLTKRAAVMESQVEVLEGKRKALGRYRTALAEIAEALGEGGGAAGEGTAVGAGGGGGDGGDGGVGIDDEPATPAMSRIVLGAQEDLRREIARAMHDGPAQSLTNIVLQAQIVERLLAQDPEVARSEVRQLVSMVQQTLDATKSFIFDVRPMVLDDLGLVPTIRRAARERGRRTGVAVDFESMGADRRLPMELESGLFRILDEAIGGYLASAPDRVAVRLDWSDDRVEGSVVAVRDRSAAIDEAERRAAEVAEQAAAKPKGKEQLSPTLAAMIEDRRAQAEAAAEAVRSAAIVSLPSQTWREIQQRAATLGIAVEQLAGGGELQISVEVPEGADSGGAVAGGADSGGAVAGGAAAGGAAAAEGAESPAASGWPTGDG